MMTVTFELEELLEEYGRAREYTDALWQDLAEAEIRWRPVSAFSPIGWHLGHQAAVAHFMVRNLVAAEPSPDPAVEPMMDSANPEDTRGELPPLDKLARYRAAVAERVIARVRDIDQGLVGAPEQLRVVVGHLLVAVVNHEYQHDQWISEVRRDQLGHEVPPRPASDRLVEIDGYTVIRA